MKLPQERPISVKGFSRIVAVGYRFCLVLGLALAGCSLPATAQHLETLGAAVSLNVTQTPVTPYFIDMGSYVLATNEDHSRYDEIGYRLATYGR